jgi:uncharacterized membrane protein YhiD involved in acid resistance
MDDFQWLIGTGLTALIFCAGVVAGFFWRILGMIRRLEDEMDRNTKELHQRVNTLRDDTVKKTDVEREFAILRQTMLEMREDQKATAKETREVLASISEHLLRVRNTS